MKLSSQDVKLFSWEVEELSLVVAAELYLVVAVVEQKLVVPTAELSLVVAAAELAAVVVPVT
jgi:hypothetical protein